MSVAIAPLGSTYAAGNTGGPATPNQGTAGFIPTVFSGKLLTKFYAATVFGEISNTDYEGEIKNQGDTVKIRTPPTLVINDYQKGMNLATQRPVGTNLDMTIDYADYFQTIIDDIDALQTDIKLMDAWATDASEQMKQTVDRRLLNTVYADAHAKNKGANAGLLSGSINLGVTGTPLVITPANVLDAILDAGLALDEQNVPETDRFIVLPAWMSRYLKSSDLKNTSITNDSTTPLRNGKVGEIDRFTVFISNNLTGVTDGAYKGFHCLAGHKSAISFASQLTKTETLRAESTFGEIMRGLQVYGYKTVRSEGLVDLYVRKG